jgi:pimeloyl-ACP methyl ester carboxylesterase
MNRIAQSDGGFDASVRLPDGRRLCYRDSGDPRGTALLFFHGIPGSRFQCPDSGLALERGVRVIAPERPGYGGSDDIQYPSRYSLSAWAADVEVLVDALGIDRFAIAGYSMGGAFALACAHRLPARVMRVGLIGSLAPLDVAGNWDGWGPVRMFYELARSDEAALMRAVEPLGTAEALLAALADTVCDVDRELLARSPIRSRLLRDAQETLRSGVRPVVRDLILGAHAWGFDPADVRVPAFLWHGADDITVPVAMARYLAAAIPGASAQICPHEGHFLMFSHWPAILSALTG